MGILYAPDFVVNAGGIINVACEVGTKYSESRAIELTEKIYDTTFSVIRASREEGVTTVESAIRLAEEIIRKGPGHLKE
jgi:glutamate dehydrogenase/leucine dehydrogenase